jgi:hypothetical protein
MAQAKRPSPGMAPRSLSALQQLNLGSGRDNEDVSMRDVSDDGQGDQPRKRAAVGDGISAGSGSPQRETSSPSPRRSRARQSPDSDLHRPPVSGKHLWTDREPLARPSLAAPLLSPPPTSTRAGKQSVPQYSNATRNEKQSGIIPQARPPGTVQIYTNKDKAGQAEEGLVDDPLRIIREPETRPISQEQLVAEVKGIYAGLVMVEAKCIEVDSRQAVLAQGDPASQPKLNNEQWQALIALHRTLLHEHHDFFLASQHPSASPALRRLASKYAMPARMWRHGIHSFLELLRHRLPASLDHMLAFIYLAYSMMALLYETVPDFEDTWIECLGDLGRYRMAIEDDDVRDRDVWTGVARHWYSKASDNAPGTGRLYHHIAILARPDSLMQLFYYEKSLCVAVPFPSARDSILTLFDPVLAGDGQHRLPPFETSFVKAHGLLFTKRDMESFQPAVLDFLKLLDNHIGRVTRKFMQQGFYIAVSNIIAMLGYGNQDNPLMMAIKDTSQGTAETKSEVDEKAFKSFHDAEYLSTEALKTILKRIGDPNVLPFVHVTLVFMYTTVERIEDAAFPVPVKDHIRPFTEDFGIRGLIWAEDYFPSTWFAEDKLDDEERHLEAASMVDVRKERILWIACQLCKTGSWMTFDREKRRFSTTLVDVPPLDSRVSTFQSVKSIATAADEAEVLVKVKTEKDLDSDVNQTGEIDKK